MKYQCEKCKKTFMYTAKKTTIPTTVGFTVTHPSNIAYPSESLETHVSPFCQNLEFTEYIEPQPQIKVTNVYVHDLTSGPQTALDGLLAQGYEITGRYAKQFILEKKEANEE